MEIIQIPEQQRKKYEILGIEVYSLQ